jgi:hypothetical protein
VTADPLLSVNAAALKVTFGAHALERGAEYARTGRVGEVHAGGDQSTRILQAAVTGSRAREYVTLVTVRASGVVTSRCSCPVGENCKHGAAVVFAMLERRQPRADWRKALAAVAASDARSRGDVAPLGLLLDLAYGRLSIRPVQRSARGKWVKTGVDWDSVQNDWASHWDESQRRAVHELARLRRPTAYGYGYPGQATLITDFGSPLWPTLRAAVAAGVALVPGQDTPPVRLLTEPADVVTRLSRDPSGLVVTSKVLLDGVERERRSVSLLGEPPHGVAVLTDDELTLAGFPGPLSPAQEHLLSRHQRIEIPDEDVPAFVGGFLPSLRRAATLSIDDDVEVPDVQPPVATLTVTFAPGQAIDLAWGFRYRVGTAVMDVAADAKDQPVRDRVAEAELLSQLPHEPWGVVDSPSRVRLVPTYRLEGAEAARFSTTSLPTLESSEHVVVTVVGDRVDYRYVESPPQVTVSVSESQGDWFNLDVRVTVDGDEIEFGPLFAALARGDKHLVLDSGAWFSLERPELDQLRAVIEEATLLAGGEPGLRLRAEHAGLWEELVALGVVAEQSAAWRQAVSGLLDASELPEVALPSGLTATLRPYQLTGYHWLTFLWRTRLGGILADDMGLGKTVQLLAAVLRAREDEPESPPVLVVAPTSVVPTWADQARQFAPGLRVEVVERTGSKRAETLDEVRVRADVVVTSYTLLRLDADEYGAHPWSAVVFDEAQFVKNRQAATYKAARRLRARVKFAVTGTPMENSLMDLWSMLSIATPGLFPSPDAFTELYRKPIETQGSPEVLARLRRRVRPVLLRRTKDEVATELPPKQEQVLSIPLSAGHRRLYDRHLAAVRKQVLGLVGDLDHNRVAILASLTRLRQLSLSPALLDPSHPPVSSKIDALVEMLGDMTAEGHRALVFSQFTSFLALVKARLDAEKIRYVYLDGRTRKREERIDSFKSGTDPVFLISLKAGGFGLNLTEADYVFVLDPWWNPAAENQAVDRAHRIGQESVVMVYRLVSEDTIEEKVVALQQRKRDLFDSVVGGAADLGAPLTADDIRGLLEAD